MSVATSSAEPDLLAAFAAADVASAEPLATALGRLSTDLAALDATVSYYAPPGFAPAECLAAVGEVQAWSSHLASWVTAVGEAFRAAGRDPDGDGVVRVRDRAVGLVGRAALDDEREWLADLLATIDERARAGERVDPRRLGRIVALARELVDAAPDPQAEARRLIERMSPADAYAAARIFGRAAADATRPTDAAILALGGLGYIVSLGLEDDPARAARWVDALTRPESPSPRLSGRATEALALFGAGNAPGTSTFGALLAVGLLAHGSAAPPLGVSFRAYGSEDALAPLIQTATARDASGFTQARLANRIVDELVSTGRGEPLMQALGGAGRGAADRSPLLLAAVDAALPERERMAVAVELAAHYHDVDQHMSALVRLVRIYERDATASFAAATQPLFEHVTTSGTEASGTLAVGSRSYGHDGVLWSAVADLAGAPGGADGLGVALAGATTARLASGYVGVPPGAATSAPFESGTLPGLAGVYTKVASTVGQSRFNDLLAHVEDDGDRLGDAAVAAAYGVAGEVPGGSTATGVTDALAILSAPDTQVLAPGSAGSPLAGVQARLTRDLVAFNLAAHPEWATGDVREALRSARAREGPDGIVLLMYDQENQFGEGHSPELSALRGAVQQQLGTTGIGQSTSAAATTSSAGG
jgi:hypothetical protein